MATFRSLGSKHMHNWPLAFHEYTIDGTQSVGSVTGRVIHWLMNSSSFSCTKGHMAIGHFLGDKMKGLASSLKVVW